MATKKSKLLPVNIYEMPDTTVYKQLSYQRETALQGGLVMVKSGRLELGDNILRTL